MDKFPCSGCGCCCKRVNRILDSWEEIRNKDSVFYFPYSWDETGRCEKLDSENKCSVYEKRPLVCSVEFVRFYFDFPKELLYKETAKSCNSFMDEDGIDETFRIKIN